MKYVALQDGGYHVFDPEDSKPLLIYQCANCNRAYRAFYRPPVMPLEFVCVCGATIVADDPQLRALPRR